MERIILDVDSAGDDILAVLFAAISSSIKLEGVTTVRGAAGAHRAGDERCPQHA